MNWMMRFFNWWTRFMSGRYGMDQLGVATVVVYLLLALPAGWVRNPILQLIALVFLALFVFRSFSRRTANRYRENQVFLKIWRPIWAWLRHPAQTFREHRTYKYYHCPTCRQTLRVPRKKGKLRIRCPKCGTEFIKKTWVTHRIRCFILKHYPKRLIGSVPLEIPAGRFLSFPYSIAI